MSRERSGLQSEGKGMRRWELRREASMVEDFGQERWKVVVGICLHQHFFSLGWKEGGDLPVEKYAGWTGE